MGRWSERARALVAPPSATQPVDLSGFPAIAVAKNDITTEGARCWWDGPPWYGSISTEEFRAIVAAYIAAHGVYTPDLPKREPGLLAPWRAARARPAL